MKALAITLIFIALLRCKPQPVVPETTIGTNYLWSDTGLGAGHYTEKIMSHVWPIGSMRATQTTDSAKPNIPYFYETGGGGIQGDSLGNYYDIK